MLYQNLSIFFLLSNAGNVLTKIHLLLEQSSLPKWGQSSVFDATYVKKQRATTAARPAGHARCPLAENLGFRHRAIKLHVVCNNFTSEIRLEKHPRIDDDDAEPFRHGNAVFRNAKGSVRQEKFR